MTPTPETTTTTATAGVRPAADQLCTFRAGPLLLGVDVRDVREVVQLTEMTVVPNAHPAIQGLINLRGRIATSVDLCRRLDVPSLGSGQDPVHLVTVSHGEPVTLLVDSIGDVVDVDPSAYEPPPTTMTGGAKELILGAYKLDDELLLVLDVRRAVEVGEPSR